MAKGKNVLIKPLYIANMKIGFLSALYGEEKRTTGGVKTCIREISEELAKRGYEVTVITCGRNRRYVKNKVKIIELSKLEIIENILEAFNPAFVFRRLLYMFRANRTVRREGFDILEVFDGGFEYLFLALSRPCLLSVGTHCNFNHHVLWPKKSRLINRLEAFSAKRCNLINAPSSGYAGIISEEYKIPLQKIKIIPNGINAKRILESKKENVRSRYGLGKRKIVLFVGELTARKGIDIFVEVARKYSDNSNVVFIAIGKKTKFSDKLKCEKNTIFTSVVSDEELLSFYRDCELLLFPTRMEAFGLVILEAFAHGKAVVTSKIPGISDLTKDGYNCLLCDPENIADYQDKVDFLLKEDSLRNQYGRDAYKTAGEFSISMSVNKRIELYKGLLQK